MFTDEEKVRIRHAMGYLSVVAVATFNLGVPAGVQTQFMIESAFDKVLPGADDLVRKLLCRCEAAEEEVFGNLDFANVEETGAVKVNRRRLFDLSQIYRMSQEGIANLMGVPPNPFDARGWLRMGSINAGVSG